MYRVRWSNEAATVHADITADHRDVPAIFQWWEEAQPKNLPVEFLFSSRFKPIPNLSVSCLHLYGFRNLTELHQGRRKFSFAQFLTSNHQTVLVKYNWGVFCTCDAFHISNSIRYFWASVCDSPGGGGGGGADGIQNQKQNKNPARLILVFYIGNAKIVKKEAILRDFLRKLNANLMASYQRVFQFFHPMLLKYCACHNKVKPSRTKCCTCLAKPS